MNFLEIQNEFYGDLSPYREPCAVVKYLSLSIVVIALKLLEGENLTATLGLFNLRILRKFTLSMDFIQKERDNFSLIDLPVIRIKLDQRLD